MKTHFAKNLEGKLIKAERGVGKLARKNKTYYYCPGCNNEVYAATEGKIQAPHFRHKSNRVHGCSEHESYTHWVSKELFAEYYKSVDFFWVEIDYPLNCEATQKCSEIRTHLLNLKKKYPHILVESYSEGMKPDCLLYNDGNEILFFEIKYTHGVSESKISKGTPIIELHTKTEKVIDMVIAQGGLKKSTTEYSLFNISPLFPLSRSFDCRDKCIDVQTQIDKPKYKREKSVRQEGRNTHTHSYWGSIYREWRKWKRECNSRQ